MKKPVFTRELKVGIMVVAAVFVLYFGINFLKGIDIFKSVNYFYCKYENVDGLVPSSPVFIKGYKVGQVEQVNYDFTKAEPFTVKISVQRQIALPRGAAMQLFDDGLMGGKAVQLVFEPSASFANPYVSGDTLRAETADGLLAQVSGSLAPKLENAIERADSLLASLQTLVAGQELHNSLANFEKITADLSVSSNKLKLLLNNDVPSVITNLNLMSDNFNSVSINLRKIDFAATFTSINQTVSNLQTLTGKLNSNDGSLGLLLNDKELYVNLKNTSNDANKLLIDLKQNPKRYLHFSLW